MFSIDTVYGYIPLIGLCVCAITMLWRYASWPNWIIFGLLASFYIVYMTAQDTLGTDQPELVSFALSIVIALSVANVARGKRRLWPLVISSLLTLNAFLDLAFYFVGDDRWVWPYQHSGACIYYICLLWLAAHPSLKVKNDEIKSRWHYA